MIDRINYIIQNKGLSLSKFAEEIGVQRSSISHILSGRNKPSLDFVTKILDRYPEISTDWLLNGKGSYQKEAELFDHDAEFAPTDKVEKEEKNIEHEKKPETIKKENTDPLPEKDTIQVSAKGKRSIRKIILMYDDATFEEIIPQKS